MVEQSRLDVVLPFMALQSQRTALDIQGEAEAQTHGARGVSNPVEAWRRPAPPQKMKMPALFAEQEGISIRQYLRHPKPGSSERSGKT